MLSQSGIYKITCAGNNQFYIGSAAVLRRRRAQHFGSAKAGEHRNSHLQRAWNKYGEDTFKFEVLLVCAREDLIMYEQRCMNIMLPKFNKDPVAGSKLGSKHSVEARKKMSRTHLGKKPRLSDDARAHKSEIIRENVQKLWSDPVRAATTRRKMLKTRKARWSKEQSNAIAARKRGNTYRLGAIISKEMRDQISSKLSKTRYEFKGAMRTCRELAELSPHNLTALIVRKRLFRGWTTNVAVETPRRTKK